MFWKDKLKDYPFLRTLLMAFLVFAGIIFITAVWLKIYTMHGRYREVPDVKGLVVYDAIGVLKDEGLRYHINDSVFQAGMKPGTVVDQNPAPGAKVKKNRKIYLVINAFQPQMIEMPNVVGVSRRQAKALLESNGLVVGNIRYVPDIAFDNVLEQRYQGKPIEPGTKIAKGSKIDLVLGRGYNNETTNIPDLKGLTLSQARSLLTDNYLNLGITVYDKTVISDIDSMNARVYKQKPSPDKISTARLGSYIDVWLTTDTVKLR